MKISAQVVGQERIVAQFQAMPKNIKNGLVRDITKLTIDLQRKVISQKLHGQVLQQRSGRLARSINQRVVQEDLKVTGSVGTNVSYGRVHELGGTVTIPQHMRMMSQAFGRPVRNPRMISVKAHQANYPERSFLRSSLSEMREQIVSRLKNSAVDAARAVMGQ